MPSTKTFSGIYSFDIFAISPSGKTRPLKQSEEKVYRHRMDITEAIYDYVYDFLEDIGATGVHLDVEAHDENGGPYVGYSIDIETDDDASPMYDLTLEGVRIPHYDEGWYIGVDGSVQYEHIDESEEKSPVPPIRYGIPADYSAESALMAKKKCELYPPFVRYLESLPNATVQVDTVSGKTVGVRSCFGLVTALLVGVRKGSLKHSCGRRWDSEKNCEVPKRVNGA